MKIAFTASSSPEAQAALVELTNRYGNHSIPDSDCVVTLGGDGMLLKTLYAVRDHGKLVYAMRRTSSVGFLCNDYNPDQLPERLAKAQRVVLHPLSVEATLADGTCRPAFAVNEVAVLRDSLQSSKLRITVDGIERLNCLSGDGILLSTPAGSTAYNRSAGGPIMPLDSNTLVMTAICGFRPHRWSYAVLPQSSVIDIEILEPEKRPVRIEAGPDNIQNIARCRLWLDCTTAFTLLFDPDQHLGERIIQEQFTLS